MDQKLSNSAKQFRRENLILFSDSENESDDSENEDFEVEEDQESEDIDLANLEFEEVKTENPQIGRPSRLRGGQNPRPKIIPEEAFASEEKLLNYVYGETIFEEICLGTNEKAEKLEPESSFLSISLDDIIQFFGHLILLWAFKPELMEIFDFWILFRACPQAFGFENYVIFCRERFNFINKHLDIGKTEYVPNNNAPGYHIIDLNAKLNPIINHFNKRSLAVKTPSLDKPLAVDESLRASHSRSCLVRQYIPSKPAKFGEKHYLLVDSDLYCLKFIFQFPKQFATFNGIDDLMDKIIPNELKHKGA